jgi:hypothetical protein
MLEMAIIVTPDQNQCLRVISSHLVLTCLAGTRLSCDTSHEGLISVWCRYFFHAYVWISTTMEGCVSVLVLVIIFCIHDTPDSWEMQFLACPIVVCDMNAEYMCCGVGLITDFIVSKNCSYTSQFADTCRVFSLIFRQPYKFIPTECWIHILHDMTFISVLHGTYYIYVP